MSKIKIFSRKYPSEMLTALILGLLLAAGVSVWATSVGTNVSVTGNLTTSGTTASSSVSYALGVGTTTPSAMFSVGGAGGTSTGHGYFSGGLGVGAITTSAGSIVANVSLGVATTTPAQTLSVVGNGYLTGGLGIGIATTTAGGLELTGNVLLGSAATNLVMFNAASEIFNNRGTTTIPAANADSWSVATSSANIPFLKYNTSSYRIGIGTTTPGATLAVGGDLYASGNLSVGTNGTLVATIQHAWIDCGPITGAYTLAATTTGILRCTAGLPQGHAAGDKVWLTASSTNFTVGLNNWYYYTGKASSTVAGTIQAEIYNASGATLTNANLGTSSWQLLLIK